MTPEIQELKRLAEAAMPSLSEMMVVEFAEFSSVRDQDGASIAQVRGGVPYFDKEVAAYIAAASPSTILALIEVAEAAQKLVSKVDDLISESHGVYGLHQNGDIAPWDTLIEGGQFEDWLLPLSDARTALEGVKK